MLVNTKDHMIPDVWTDSQTQEVHHDEEYNGPKTWAEASTGDDAWSPVLLCAITWDDMWLTDGEIKYMMENIMELEEAKERGVAWQYMRVVWRDDIQHFVLEVPAYRTKEENQAAWDMRNK